MRKLIDFFKKLFGYKEVCPKCKSNPCKCEIAVPTEHVRTVESVPSAEFAQETTVEFPTTIKSEAVSASKEEVNVATKPVIKKKRAPRKKKATAEKK